MSVYPIQLFEVAAGLLDATEYMDSFTYESLLRAVHLSSIQPLKAKHNFRMLKFL